MSNGLQKGPSAGLVFSMEALELLWYWNLKNATRSRKSNIAPEWSSWEIGKFWIRRQNRQRQVDLTPDLKSDLHNSQLRIIYSKVDSTCWRNGAKVSLLHPTSCRWNSMLPAICKFKELVLAMNPHGYAPVEHAQLLGFYRSFMTT